MADVWTVTPEKLKVYAKVFKAIARLTENRMDCEARGGVLRGTGWNSRIPTTVEISDLAPKEPREIYIRDVEKFADFLKQASRRKSAVTLTLSEKAIEAEAADWASWKMWYQTELTPWERSDYALKEREREKVYRLEAERELEERIQRAQGEVHEVTVRDLEAVLRLAVKAAREGGGMFYEVSEVKALATALSELAPAVQKASVALYRSVPAMKVRLEAGGITVRVTLELPEEVVARLSLP